jgi:hypothetical protein
MLCFGIAISADSADLAQTGNRPTAGFRIIGIQKKVAALLGMPMATPECDEMS